MRDAKELAGSKTELSNNNHVIMKPVEILACQRTLSAWSAAEQKPS
jgi:hypothetical protein